MEIWTISVYETIGTIKERSLMSAFFEILKTKTIYIFGAGERGKIVNSILTSLKIETSGFIDNDVRKQGKTINGVKCYALSDVENLKEDISVIVSPLDNKKIMEQLEKYNNFHLYDGEIIIKESYYCPYKEDDSDYYMAKPFNHYESPYADIREIHKKEKEIFNYNKQVLDIDFNVNRQLELLQTMKQLNIINWNDSERKYRYTYNNTWFCKGSADVLYYMMKILNPNKIIEVGSGFSTAVMLDTNNESFNNKIDLISIEPNSDRLKSLLEKKDNIRIYEKNLQDIPLDLFEQLQENDILFIDSSHVARVDGDVNYYLFEIFPRLKSGVYIHFHDMFYPFIYPKEWIYSGIVYNEMYLLRAFLMNNKNYSIQFWGDMIMKLYPEKLDSKVEDISGSLWIKKE